MGTSPFPLEGPDLKAAAPQRSMTSAPAAGSRHYGDPWPTTARCPSATTCDGRGARTMVGAYDNGVMDDAKDARQLTGLPEPGREYLPMSSRMCHRRLGSLQRSPHLYGEVHDQGHLRRTSGNYPATTTRARHPRTDRQHTSA